MKEKIQRIHRAIGSAGCYALACVQAARPEMSAGQALDIIAEGISRKYIYLNLATMSDPENMRVDDAGALVCLARGEHPRSWVRHAAAPGYQPRPEELVIEKWAWGSKTHFIVRVGSVPWDPYGDSETVKNGKLESYRIFSRV